MITHVAVFTHQHPDGIRVEVSPDVFETMSNAEILLHAGQMLAGLLEAME